MDDGQGILQRFMDGGGLIQLPLQARPHPIQAPLILCANIPDAGEGTLPRRGFVLPVWSDLLEVDGMTHDGIAEIQLRADVLRRSPSREEPFECSMVGRTPIL